MDAKNIEGLKKTLGINESNSTESTEKYVNLINLVFIEKLINVESYEEDADQMVWSFEDGTIIKLGPEEIVELMSLIMKSASGIPPGSIDGFHNMN